MNQQCASDVILIRPVGFGYDPETALSNPFQHSTTDPDVRTKAEAEFDGLVSALDRSGIGITVLDPTDPSAPNGVFPNNWFSTHADGTVVLYPMCTPSRRRERDRQLDDALDASGFKVRRMIDLTALETDDRFLEGTGSLVLDRGRGVAYAAMSPRTTERAINYWCGALRCGPVPFAATMDGTPDGTPIYHTNVLMSIGEKFALICLDAIPLEVEREDVKDELMRGGKELILISREQMVGYVGNVLQLRNTKGDAFIFLSMAAHALLEPDQLRALERHGEVVAVAIPTIETVGGGGVRCMIAENFLPRK